MRALDVDTRGRSGSLSGGAADRVALAVVVLSSVWYAFTAFWGIFGAPGSGHLGAGSAGNTMAAEQIVRWHILYPAWDWYLPTPPPATNYICHHPFGQYYVPALFLAVFGHRDFVVHLPAALMSAAVPPLLYGIAKEPWGRAAGAVAAAAYVVVPVAVGFSSFTNLEVFCIFGSLLFFWGHTRHMVTGRRGHLVASLVGLLFACSGDWAGYLLVALLLVWSLFRCFVLPARLTPPFRFQPYARWWALSVGLATATLVFWLVLFARADQIADWVISAVGRAGADDMKLKAVLASRKNWIDFSFTPLAIQLGKIAAPLCLLRLLVFRRDEEVYSLSLLFGATLQYLVFKQGADVHIFWSMYFAPYYALALAQLVHAAAGGFGLLVGRVAPERRRAGVAWVTLGLGLAPALLMAHDGVASLWVWRRTGGRYDEMGMPIRSQLDAVDVVKQVLVPRVGRGVAIDANGTAQFGWEHQWTYRGPVNNAGFPLSRSKQVATHPFWIARGSGLMADEQRKVVAAAHVRIYGDTWLVDQREPPAPLDAYAVEEREPSVLEWLLFGGTEPRRKVGTQPDPWLTWEWRTHLGQDAVEPTGEPRTLDQMRIAHNVAIARGDLAAARRWREKIDARLDHSVAARFDSVADLVGERILGGVEPRIETWFEATTPSRDDFMFDVVSTVVARARWSLIPRDEVDRDMSWPPSLPTKLWKQGYLYRLETVMDHRIGRERYVGRWLTRDGAPPPRRVDGRPVTTLAVVE